MEYYDEETHRENEDGLLPLDYTRSIDLLYTGCKIRNAFLDRRSFQYSQELQFCDERTLIYLDIFAICMQNREESDTKDRTETLTLQFFSTLVQKMDEISALIFYVR